MTEPRTVHVPARDGGRVPDVLTFQRSGVSIAMGNASPDVQRAATFVTTSNTEDGFARAMERFVLRTPTAGQDWP